MKKLDQSKFLKYFTSTGIDVPTVSMVYKTSRYVGQFPLMTKSGFSEFHVDVFYEPNPDRDLGHSYYFAIYQRVGGVYIIGAEHIEKLILSVYTDSEGYLIYSRFQHDFRSFKTSTGDVSIDGGWWMPVPGYEGYSGMCGRTLWDGGLCPRGKTVVVRDGEFYEVEEGEVL